MVMSVGVLSYSFKEAQICLAAAPGTEESSSLDISSREGCMDNEKVKALEEWVPYMSEDLLLAW